MGQEQPRGKVSPWSTKALQATRISQSEIVHALEDSTNLVNSNKLYVNESSHALPGLFQVLSLFAFSRLQGSLKHAEQESCGQSEQKTPIQRLRSA